jgi:hypothetical protein
MKAKKKELDVDFIGSQEPLSKEEEKSISDFFLSKKKERTQKTPMVSKRISKKKSTV